MPGATVGLDLVRLMSGGDSFQILGRFPAGFERPAPGGYSVAEEFLVLGGALELEDRVVQRGALCFLPAGLVRAPMRSPGGCTVLARFGGAPDFRAADELRPSPELRMLVTSPLSAPPGTVVLDAGDARWQIADSGSLPAGWTDVVDAGLTTWACAGAAAAPVLPPGPVLVRVAATPTTPTDVR